MGCGGDVAELVDAPDLKSVDFGRPGSIPGVPTNHFKMADVTKKAATGEGDGLIYSIFKA